VTPCPPELLLLPRWLPFHPARYYCHTRHIYLAMAYLHGRRFTAELGPLGSALREELYGVPYATLDFAGHRARVAAADLAVAPGRWLRALRAGLDEYEHVHLAGLRRRALDACLARIVYEQRASRQQALSPVNGVLNCLALWAADPRHADLGPSLDGLERWRWEDAAGVRYAGARSNAWDTAFAMRALAASGDPRAAAALARAARFLLDTQMREELPRWWEEARDPIEGGWCFSDGGHRWPVSDCTAEATTALLAAGAALPGAERPPAQRLVGAARFILARQNADGGFGTYEAQRGGGWLDRLNPSEMFGQCMTERSHVECTASCVAALTRLGAEAPALAGEVVSAVAHGVRFLRGRQRPDGSVPAFWGINFTYGAFHLVTGLVATGVARDDPALARAADWLITHQRADGGWGEHWSGCLDRRYVERESQAVQTAWAVLALLEVVGPEHEAVQRGIAWLVARQGADGGWPPEGVNGVFFGSAMLDYRLYRAYFPAWALARHAVLAAAGR